MLALFGFDAQFLRAFEIGAAFNDRYIAHFSQGGNAVAEFFHDGFLPGPEFGQVQGRLGESDTAVGGFTGGDNLVGGVQQRLGGNAAAVQANATEPPFTFDQNDLFAEVGGIEGRGVTAGTGADDYNFRFDWIHS